MIELERQAVSDHATTRSKQRGVPLSAVDAVLTYGDIESPNVTGRRCRQVSSKAVVDMLADGLSLAEVEAARRIALIVASDGCVITVLNIRPNTRRKRARLRRCRGRR